MTIDSIKFINFFDYFTIIEKIIIMDFHLVHF
jgi:hypothetical protein